MAQQQNKQEQDIHQLLKVRREKLSELQNAGKDPFQITKYDQHPQEKLGEMAAELLLKLIHCEEHRNRLPEDPSKEKMKEPVCTDILIAPELVIGNSCIVRDPIEKSMS